MLFPEMALVRQSFDPARVEDVPAALKAGLAAAGIRQKITPGQRIAVTAGSRGITNIAVITKCLVEFLKECGGRPFVFPAMGSHGGATAEGQKALLSTFGITEEAMGCPIISGMETEEIGKTPDGLPVFVDRNAMAADQIVVMNRVKPHTKFEGPIESGLMKMMAIGMGKRHGADLYHKAFVQFGINRVIETAGLLVAERCPILCGVGLVENGYHETAIVRVLTPGEIFEEEKALLLEARKRMARIPFSHIDLLIVDEMGKNISGTGMDTNVTGVNRDILGTFSSEPQTRRLFVRDLSDDSEGNALGIGFADITTTRLVEKIDREKTYTNCLTAISPEKGAIPIHFDTDRECLEAVFNTLGMVDEETLRVVHIQNTLSLERLHLSRAYEADIRGNPNLEIMKSWKPLALGPDDQLLSPFSAAMKA
jgi:hypothetical protein